MITAFVVGSVFVTGSALLSSNSEWAAVINTALLIVLTLLANKNRTRTKEAAHKSREVSDKIDATRERLEDGYVEKIAEAVSDTVITHLKEAGVFGRRRPTPPSAE